MSAPGPSWLRRAGTARLANDDVVLWSVAEGERGRRWRWMHQVHQGFLGTTGLVELSPDGHFRRLELCGFGGLMTLHPAMDGRSAHGNIVTVHRVQPIETSWQAGWAVGFADDPFGSAVAGWGGSGLVVVQQGDSFVWREPGRHPEIAAMPMDERGIPIVGDSEEWALEV